jgi:hypothetical protein
MHDTSQSFVCFKFALKQCSVFPFIAPLLIFSLHCVCLSLSLSERLESLSRYIYLSLPFVVEFSPFFKVFSKLQLYSHGIQHPVSFWPRAKLSMLFFLALDYAERKLLMFAGKTWSPGMRNTIQDVRKCG